MKLVDVIIIGKGPAGISASLYTQRANLETLVIGREGSSLEKAEKIENYVNTYRKFTSKTERLKSWMDYL